MYLPTPKDLLFSFILNRIKNHKKQKNRIPLIQPRERRKRADHKKLPPAATSKDSKKYAPPIWCEKVLPKSSVLIYSLINTVSY